MPDVPFCVNCKHSKTYSSSGAEDMDCMRRPAGISPVSGQPLPALSHDCWEERAATPTDSLDQRCGPEGRFFEAKDA